MPFIQLRGLLAYENLRPCVVRSHLRCPLRERRYRDLAPFFSPSKHRSIERSRDPFCSIFPPVSGSPLESPRFKKSPLSFFPSACEFLARVTKAERKWKMQEEAKRERPRRKRTILSEVRDDPRVLDRESQ